MILMQNNKEISANNNSKRMLGVYDLRVSPISLGGMLILIEELQMQCFIHNINYADVCIVDDTPVQVNSYQAHIDDKADKILENNDSGAYSLLPLIQDLKNVERCFYRRSVEDFNELRHTSSNQYIIWPPIKSEKHQNHNYQCTLFAQKFYFENGFIPYLSCKKNILQWALQFIVQRASQNLPIVVHLKNNQDTKGCSNANFNAWMKFFSSCYGKYNIIFILIGNEPIDQQIYELPNVIVARDYGSSLVRDLALIQLSFMFLGMSSGPCNMAIFNQIPYIIYKNPDHDTKQMSLQLDRNDRFPFASYFQKFLRVFETSDILMSEFDNLFTRLSRQDWETRLLTLT